MGIFDCFKDLTDEDFTKAFHNEKVFNPTMKINNKKIDISDIKLGINFNDNTRRKRTNRITKPN